MWATLVLVGMLSLCVSEGRVSASDETGVRVLQVRDTRSRKECSRQCKEASVPDGVICNWSTVYQKHCLLIHCRSLLPCLKMKGGDIAELLAGLKDFTNRKKRDGQAVLFSKRRRDTNGNASSITSGAVTSATIQTTSPRIMLETQAPLVPLTERTSTTNHPLTSSSLTAPASSTSVSTVVIMQASVTTIQPTTLSLQTAVPAIQTAVHITETTLVTTSAVVPLQRTSSSSQLIASLTPNTTYATSASKVTTEATTQTSTMTLNSTYGTSSFTTKPPQPTSAQGFSVSPQPVPTSFRASTVISATLKDADSSTVEMAGLTTVIPNATNTNSTEPQSQTSDVVPINTNQLANNDSLINSATKPLLVPVTGQTFDLVTNATATVSEITPVVKSSAIPGLITKMIPKPTLLPTTTTHKQTVPSEPEEPLTYTPTAKKETTMSKTTLPTLQGTHSTGSTKPISQSPTSLPGDRQNYVNSDKYLVATWPLARHLMDTSSLLAVLLFGIVFFLAVIFVFAAQAYESYKKKDYTQVDYLINGMYTDSEL